MKKKVTAAATTAAASERVEKNKINFLWIWRTGENNLFKKNEQKQRELSSLRHLVFTYISFLSFFLLISPPSQSYTSIHINPSSSTKINETRKWFLLIGTRVYAFYGFLSLSTTWKKEANSVSIIDEELLCGVQNWLSKN